VQTLPSHGIRKPLPRHCSVLLRLFTAFVYNRVLESTYVCRMCMFAQPSGHPSVLRTWGHTILIARSLTFIKSYHDKTKLYPTPPLRAFTSCTLCKNISIKYDKTNSSTITFFCSGSSLKIRPNRKTWAYDSVRREALYIVLIEFGIPMKLVRHSPDRETFV
jgi:hypothetical protein